LQPVSQREIPILMKLHALILFLMGPLLSASTSSSPAGLWTTVDDKTGVAKSIVEIKIAEDGELTGRVVDILHSERGPNPLCTDCKGKRKNQPIKGMTILWGMEAADGVWKGGRILDPKNGKIYSCRLRLLENGDLEVRGFIGFSLIGRSQVWKRT